MNSTPITNGLFTVPLDFGVGIFTGTNLWLEVDVRTNGGGLYTMLSPLQALTPSPYAIMSDSASNLLGFLPASQLSGAVSATFRTFGFDVDPVAEALYPRMSPSPGVEPLLLL